MEIDHELADRVMRLVVSPDYRPVKPKAIAGLLNLDGDGYREVRRVVKQLVKEGRLLYASNHLVMSTGAVGGPDDLLRGSFRTARGGDFGFVRPNQTGDDIGGEGDIFIPPGKTEGAMDGDLVEVRVRGGGRDAAPRGLGRGSEGRVTQIVQRAKRQFTGTLRSVGGQACVYLDGTSIDCPVPIGDVRGLPVENGDKIFVEIVEFPAAGKSNHDDPMQGQKDTPAGSAVLLERLGSQKNPAIDTMVIIRQYALRDEFESAVIDDARRVADAFDEDDTPPGRTDLSDVPTVTIDPTTARDFDDAISLSRDGDQWTLWVHIADVSSFVPIGSRLDDEARKRSTSVYLPDRVLPMLPEIISNHLASLQPERRRWTKSVEIVMNDKLQILHTQVHNAIIRSDRRLTYEQVDQFLENDAKFRDPDSPNHWGGDVCDLIADMHTLAMKMRRDRFRRGALSMDMPEIRLDIDAGGKVKGARRSENTESHQIIEEFMLAANQAVATWLDDAEYHFLHRIHPPPQRRKLKQLSQFVRDLNLGIDHVESRFEIQATLDRVAGTPLESAVNFAVLRAMSKAVYGPQVEGHYALDMAHYCHFTSPIRRYPDLTVHRLVQRILDGEKTPDESMGMLLKLGQHCSDAERNAADAERDLTELKLLHFLRKHIGDTMRAVISRVYPDGLEARCLKLPVDGYVSVHTLPPDQYRYDRRGNVLRGNRDRNRFRLGDAVTVRIDRVDLQRRQLYLNIQTNHSVGKPPTSNSSPGKADSKRRGTGIKKSRKDARGKRGKSRRR